MYVRSSFVSKLLFVYLHINLFEVVRCILNSACMIVYLFVYLSSVCLLKLVMLFDFSFICVRV